MGGTTALILLGCVAVAVVAVVGASRLHKGMNSQASGPLPPGWQAVVDEKTGDTYFHEIATGKTQWNRPVAGGAAYRV